MSEVSKYEAYKKKMQGICDENDLVFRFRRDKYPITLTISPAGGLSAQMAMLENVEESGYTSPDAAMVFTYRDGVLSYKTSKTFTISDALFSKIKNLFKNMHFTWLQFFFRDVTERGLLTERQMPQIDDDDDDLPEDAEAPESFEGDAFPDDDHPEGEDAADGETEVAPADASDPLIAKAAQIVRHENKATVSLLQRHLQIGYAKASRLMDDLEAAGVVGPYDGSNPREVLPYDEPVDGSDGEGDYDADES